MLLVGKGGGEEWEHHISFSYFAGEIIVGKESVGILHFTEGGDGVGDIGFLPYSLHEIINVGGAEAAYRQGPPSVLVIVAVISKSPPQV